MRVPIFSRYEVREIDGQLYLKPIANSLKRAEIKRVKPLNAEESGLEKLTFLKNQISEALHAHKQGNFQSQNCQGLLNHCKANGLSGLLFFAINLYRFPADQDDAIVIFKKPFELAVTKASRISLRTHHLNEVDLREWRKGRVEKAFHTPEDFSTSPEAASRHHWDCPDWIKSHFFPTLDCQKAIAHSPGFEQNIWRHYSEPLELLEFHLEKLLSVLDRLSDKNSEVQEEDLFNTFNLFNYPELSADSADRDHELGLHFKHPSIASRAPSFLTVYTYDFLKKIREGNHVEECAYERCSNRFLTTRKDKKYCSESCKKKVHKKTYEEKRNPGTCVICGCNLLKFQKKYCKKDCRLKGDAKRKQAIREKRINPKSRGDL